MMPSIEERVTRLEEQYKTSAEKTDILFAKLDKLTDKLEKYVDLLKSIETEHASCIRIRNETTGWFAGRATKILDAALAGGLIILLMMLLKNAGAIMPMIGGGK